MVTIEKTPIINWGGRIFFDLEDVRQPDGSIPDKIRWFDDDWSLVRIDATSPEAIYDWMPRDDERHKKSCDSCKLFQTECTGHVDKSWICSDYEEKGD